MPEPHLEYPSKVSKALPELLDDLIDDAREHGDGFAALPDSEKPFHARSKCGAVPNLASPKCA